MRGFAHGARAGSGRFPSRVWENVMFKRIKQYAASLIAGFASLFVAGAASAQATNPAASVFTDLGEVAGLVIAAGYVLMGIVLAGLLTMKIVKKVMSRAS